MNLDQELRRWSVEKAIHLLHETTTVPDVPAFLLETAGKIETFVNGGFEENLTHNEGTLNKVHDALRENALGDSDIIEVIRSLQNRGILFRERAEDA